MNRQPVFKSKYALGRDHGYKSDAMQAPVPAAKASNSSTVAEASRRWCPFVRIREYQEGQIEGTAVNRTLDGEDSAPHGSLCLASGCMAWRWDIAHAWDEKERRQEPRGYCGLAGQPF